MYRHKSLVVWQRAHALTLIVFRTTDRLYHPRSKDVFNQIRRAVLSIQANIVEGYALGKVRQFQRHVRIALGSAAEAEGLIEVAGELCYLPEGAVKEIGPLLDGTLRTLHGLLRTGVAPK